MTVMLRPGQGMWIRMLVLAALAYGGSFVVRNITTALTGIVHPTPGATHVPSLWVMR